MGNISNEERARRQAEAQVSDAGNPNANNTAVEAYEAAMERFDIDDPTRLKPVDPTDPNIVTVRVLPKGDGKISKGVYDQQTNSFPFHKKGDRLQLHKSIALAQEDNGFVEIETE